MQLQDRQLRMEQVQGLSFRKTEKEFRAVHLWGEHSAVRF